MMQRVPTENGDPIPITSATLDDVKNFKRNPTNPVLGPQANVLILDFNKGNGSRSYWNKKAVKIFAEIFMRDNNQYKIEEVSEAFKTHIFQLKNHYKNYKKFLADSARTGNQLDALRTNEANIHNSRMGRRYGVRHIPFHCVCCDTQSTCLFFRF